MEIKVQLLYVSRYDFKDDSTGEVIRGCKLTYSTQEPIKEDDRIGYKVNTCNLPYEKFNDLKKLTFPFTEKTQIRLLAYRLMIMPEIFTERV